MYEGIHVQHVMCGCACEVLVRLSTCKRAGHGMAESRDTWSVLCLSHMWTVWYCTIVTVKTSSSHSGERMTWRWRPYNVIRRLIKQTFRNVYKPTCIDICTTAVSENTCREITEFLFRYIVISLNSVKPEADNAF